MSSIQTGIELNDQFTGVIYSIIHAVNLTVSTMEDMQQTMNADMDTSGMEDVRDEINQAAMAMNELNAAMQSLPVVNTDAPTVPQAPDPVEVPFTPEQSRSPPDPVEIPVTWNTDGLAVFTGTGMERFQQEVQSTNSMWRGQYNDTQDVIARQAYNTGLLFPPGILSEFEPISSTDGHHPQPYPADRKQSCEYRDRQGKHGTGASAVSSESGSSGTKRTEPGDAEHGRLCCQ